jgi:Domain of unknown function (DUF4224)
MKNVLTFAELQEISGYKCPSRVEKCLREQGIKFFRSKYGIWTTIDIINAASGIQSFILPYPDSPEQDLI